MRESIRWDRWTGPQRALVLTAGLGAAGLALGLVGPALAAAPTTVQERVRRARPGRAPVSGRSRRR